MNNTRNVSKDRQQNVDEKISSTSSFKEDTQRGEDDGEEDLTNVAASDCHV